MTTNKIIFAIVGAIILVLVLFVSFGIKKADEKAPQRAAPWDFSIWILEDRKEDFTAYIDTFKKINPVYANKRFVIESFQDKEIYYNTLVSAIISWEAPDMFVMDNREKSPLQNQALGIDPDIVSPNDFRLRFSPLFSEDLIVWDSEDESKEFLKWIPLGYETLGIFYSRKYFLRPSELSTWTDFAKEVKNISEKQSQVIPLALWNTQISHASDIISSLLVIWWDETIYDTERTKARAALSLNGSYAGKDGDNKYELLTRSFEWKTDVDYFTEWDVAGLIGYPRDLLKIADIGYQKSFLFATPFPQYAGGEKKAAIKYNYFVANKDSTQTDIAQKLLAYMSSGEGQESYQELFPYYLSPELALSWDLQEKKIIPEYNIVYKNFVDDTVELVSYDMWSVVTFENEIEEIINENSDYDKRFADMKESIVCATAKHTTLLNLSSSCK